MRHLLKSRMYSRVQCVALQAGGSSLCIAGHRAPCSNQGRMHTSTLVAFVVLLACRAASAAQDHYKVRLYPCFQSWVALIQCADASAQVLGLERSASDREIRKAYRRLALEHHPDKQGGGEMNDAFVEIAKAYEVLSDPDARAAFDAGKEVSLVRDLRAAVVSSTQPRQTLPPGNGAQRV